MSTTYTQIGDRIRGDRVIAEYKNFQPKKGHREAHDGGERSEMTVLSAICTIEKPIRTR